MYGDVIRIAANKREAGIDERRPIEPELIRLVQDMDGEIQSLLLEEGCHVGHEVHQLVEPGPERNNDCEAMTGGRRARGTVAAVGEAGGREDEEGGGTGQGDESDQDGGSAKSGHGSGRAWGEVGGRSPQAPPRPASLTACLCLCL